MRFIVPAIGGAVALAALFIFPVLLFALLVLNLICHTIVFTIQLIVARFSADPPNIKTSPMNEPFVSIHVPAHNEPPEVVIQTLRSLSGLKWSNYEVLVIDNNTSDPNLWKPLERICAELGEKFRFFHVEGLTGFKAGAMNYVRQHMDPRAEFIFVVDADYVVDSTALRIAVKYVSDAKVGLIQFPQDYRNVCDANRGIALDYKHFFSGFMTMGNVLGCVASTGTLALVQVKALEKIGGFRTDFVTEDAELGLQLALHGYRSVYVNRRIGAGLIPHELDGLKKQRWRWTFGNAQILRRQGREILLNQNLTLKQKLGFLSHLTAWFNFNLIPNFSLIGLGIYSLVAALSVEQVYCVPLAGWTLVTYFFFKYGVLYYSLRPEGSSLWEIWKAYVTHLGLSWIFSASWIRCIFNSSSPFVRTNKFLTAAVPGILRSTLIELSLGVGLLGAAVVFTLADFLLGPLAAAMMGAARLSIYWVAAQTRHTLEVTTSLFAPEQAPVQIMRSSDQTLSYCR